MRYWWVSQNQTYQFEVPGGYLWSPKRRSDGSRYHYYEMMREVSPGDIVFSFQGRKIKAMGIVLGPAYTCPKPREFGSAGAVWNEIGWRVDVEYVETRNQIEPRHHMNLITQHLPQQYSPIRHDGEGNQMYLTEISEGFAQVLLGLIGAESNAIEQKAENIQQNYEDYALAMDKHNNLLDQWEEVKLDEVGKDESLSITEKEQVISSRRGQGIFRKRVAEREAFCRITRINQHEHLIASHIKPWKVSDNKERLDGENGLFLTPNVDHLFNDGYISFKPNGQIVVSPVIKSQILERMGVPTTPDFNAGEFSQNQRQYLEYHRDCILLMARG